MKSIIVTILCATLLISCLPSKCDYPQSDLIKFDNPDSLGISFTAHKDYDDYLFAEHALEREIGEKIEYGTTTGQSVEEVANAVYQLATIIPGATLDKVEQGEKDGFTYYIYSNIVADKKDKEQLTLYIGNDTLVSSLVITFPAGDGGCYDEALAVIHSAELNLEGYKAPFVPYSNRRQK